MGVLCSCSADGTSSHNGRKRAPRSAAPQQQVEQQQSQHLTTRRGDAHSTLASEIEFLNTSAHPPPHLQQQHPPKALPKSKQGSARAASRNDAQRVTNTAKAEAALNATQAYSPQHASTPFADGQQRVDTDDENHRSISDTMSSGTVSERGRLAQRNHHARNPLVNSETSRHLVPGNGNDDLASNYSTVRSSSTATGTLSLGFDAPLNATPRAQRTLASGPAGKGKNGVGGKREHLEGSRLDLATVESGALDEQLVANGGSFPIIFGGEPPQAAGGVDEVAPSLDGFVVEGTARSGSFGTTGGGLGGLYSVTEVPVTLLHHQQQRARSPSHASTASRARGGIVGLVPDLSNVSLKSDMLGTLGARSTAASSFWSAGGGDALSHHEQLPSAKLGLAKFGTR